MNMGNIINLVNMMMSDIINMELANNLALMLHLVCLDRSSRGLLRMEGSGVMRSGMCMCLCMCMCECVCGLRIERFRTGVELV